MVDITIGFKPTPNTFALRVSGDAMIARHVCNGDIVILEYGSDPFPKTELPKYPDLFPSYMRTSIVNPGFPMFGLDQDSVVTPDAKNKDALIGSSTTTIEVQICQSAQKSGFQN
jgi:hypothetical protein